MRNNTFLVFYKEYIHFSCDERHRNVRKLNKYSIQIAEKVYDDDNINKKKAKTRRLERELAWTYRLQTIYPLGLNSRIKGLGIVSREGRHKD